MPPPLINGTIHHVFRHNVEGAAHTVETSFSVNWDGATALGVMVNDAVQAYSQNWVQHMHDKCTITECATIARDNGGAEHVMLTPLGIPGGQAVTALPPSVALLIHKITSTRGRKNRGRMFLPGIPAEYMVDNNGRLSAATLGALQIAADDMLADLAVSGVMIILHKDQSAPGIVDSLSVDPIVGTLRKRLRD